MIMHGYLVHYLPGQHLARMIFLMVSKDFCQALWVCACGGEHVSSDSHKGMGIITWPI